jgi:hypothetical protein
MDNLGVDSRPSSLNILKVFYRNITRLDEYLKQNVSESRFGRITAASQENEGLKTLLHTALVCVNPNYLMDGDDEMDREISILSIGDHATQSEVRCFTWSSLTARL